jgi:hypothetical protein
MSELHIVETNSAARGEAVGMRCACPFWYLAKYEGERGPRPDPTGDDAADRLASLQADLADPACFELIVGGDSFPTQVWRK